MKGFKSETRCKLINPNNLSMRRTRRDYIQKYTL